MQISQSPMSQEEHEFAERLLVRLVAQAFVADHPDLFSPLPRQAYRATPAGASPTTNVPSVASSAKDGGPEISRSVEHEGNKEPFTRKP